MGIPIHPLKGDPSHEPEQLGWCQAGGFLSCRSPTLQKGLLPGGAHRIFLLGPLHLLPRLLMTTDQVESFMGSSGICGVQGSGNSHAESKASQRTGSKLLLAAVFVKDDVSQPPAYTRKFCVYHVDLF